VPQGVSGQSSKDTPNNNCYGFFGCRGLIA